METISPSFLDTHPLSPVQSAKLSQWAGSSRPGIRYIETESVCFRVREGGSKRPTVVLFADGPNTLEHHDPIFEKLAKWTRVVAIDPPGFGFSTPNPDFDFKVGAFANAFVELLISLGAGPYVLCPTCTNVYPSALIAAEHPELVSHLACECISHGGNFCLASLIQSWFGPDVDQPAFPTFSQPALAVWGMNDRSHRKSDKRSLLNIAPHAKYVEREGVGHFPEIEDPVWFDRLLRQFLRDNGMLHIS